MKKRKYMSNEDFTELKLSLEQALQRAAIGVICAQPRCPRFQSR